MSFIYLHKNKINGKCYVGQTSQAVEKRWKNGTGYVQSTKFYSAIQKYGWDNFEHIILCECPEEEADELEKQYIIEYDCLNNGYNLESGGSANKHLAEGTKEKIGQANSIALKGKHPSEETRKKLCEANAGGNNGFYGKHHTEETKQHLSEIRKGKSLWNGKLPDEIKQKISESKYIPVICIETGEMFASIREATQKTGINNISRAIITGIRAGGYHWKKVGIEERNGKN